MTSRRPIGLTVPYREVKEKKPKWQELKQSEVREIWWNISQAGQPEWDFYKIISAKLKEKNT